jgi:hypothetical protein
MLERFAPSALVARGAFRAFTAAAMLVPALDEFDIAIDVRGVPKDRADRKVDGVLDLGCQAVLVGHLRRSLVGRKCHGSHTTRLTGAQRG